MNKIIRSNTETIRGSIRNQEDILNKLDEIVYWINSQSNENKKEENK